MLALQFFTLEKSGNCFIDQNKLFDFYQIGLQQTLLFLNFHI